MRQVICLISHFKKSVRMSVSRTDNRTLLVIDNVAIAVILVYNGNGDLFGFRERY